MAKTAKQRSVFSAISLPSLPARTRTARPAALWALALLATSLAAPAQAGFVWTPPPPATHAAHGLPAINASPLQPGPAVRAAPVEAVDAMQMPSAAMDAPRAPHDGGITPWPIAAHDGSAAYRHQHNNPDTLDRSVASEPLAAPLPAISWNAVPPIRETAPALPHEHHETIEGFGSDIPLAIALQQIVPARYAYSFGTGVDPGQTVSWNGGRPWSQVLNAALAPAGLQAGLSGQAIIIERTGMASAPAWHNAPAAAGSDAAWIPPATEANAAPLRLGQEQRASLPYPAIGMDDSDYQPSYPRRAPSRGLQGDGPQTVNGSPSRFRDIFTRRDQSAAATPAAAHAAHIQPAAGDAGAPIALVGADMPDIPGLPSFTDEKIAFPSPFPAPAIPDTAANATGTTTPEHRAAAPRGPGALDLTEIRYWHAPQGADLQAVLSQWASDSGINLLWQTGTSYTLPAAIQMHGTFADAVAEVLSIYEEQRLRPTGQLYTHQPDGGAALVING